MGHRDSVIAASDAWYSTNSVCSSTSARVRLTLGSNVPIGIVASNSYTLLPTSGNVSRDAKTENISDNDNPFVDVVVACRSVVLGFNIFDTKLWMRESVCLERLLVWGCSAAAATVVGLRPSNKLAKGVVDGVGVADVLGCLNEDWLENAASANVLGLLVVCGSLERVAGDTSNALIAVSNIRNVLNINS